MRPVVFCDTIGWLHAAGGRRGVVIAGAHGLEDLCSRRFLTTMARRIAKEGLPVLQFDYPGCGDAAGDHTGPARVPAWLASLGAAIERLKRETGVHDVLVIGFRIGALLAPTAIAGRSDVAGLALLAPPPSGKACVREMTGLSRMIDAALPAHAVAEHVPFDGIQAAGFRLTAKTVAALGEIDWRADLQRSSVDDILLMPVAPSPLAARYAEEMRLGGRNVAIEAFDGYHRLMCDPTANEIPESVLETVVAWAGVRAGAEVEAETRAASTGDFLRGPHYREWPLAIGGGTEICGVLCLPAEAAVSGSGDTGSLDMRDVVLFLNSGGVPHVGWARGTVEAARTLAAEGRASLRIDLPGLGQSEAPSGKRLFLYDVRTRTDVARVLDWLEAKGFRRVCAVGTCSGAFQAFHAARQDPRITHLTMVNPLCFAWNSSYALDMGVWKAYENAKVARRTGEEEETVAPTAAGGLAPLRALGSRAARRLARRMLELFKSGLAGLSRVGLADGRQVERWMCDLVARGTAVLMVTSEGDLSLEEIARHFGPNGERLARMPSVTMRQLPACDHTLTPLHARRMLVAHLVEFLRPERPCATAASRVERPLERLRLLARQL